MSHATPEMLFAALEQLSIDTTTIEHPPVYTVQEAKQHRTGLSGSFIKNLFLRNKKKQMWLVVVPEDHRVDLKDLGRQLGAGHLSFGRPERLRQFLGVEPGSVTPFAIMNDQERAVTLVIDRRVAERDPIYCHPLVNNMTTAIRFTDLLRFVRAHGHEPTLMDLTPQS